MAQNNEELDWRNWRNPGWLDSFFDDFNQELRLCHSDNLEHNLQISKHIIVQDKDVNLYLTII